MTKNLKEDQAEGRSGLSSLMAHLCSETGHSCIRVGTYSVANFSRVLAWESNTTCLTSAPYNPAAVRKTRNAEQRKGVMDRNHLCHCMRFQSSGRGGGRGNSRPPGRGRGCGCRGRASPDRSGGGPLVTHLCPVCGVHNRLVLSSSFSVS